MRAKAGPDPRKLREDFAAFCEHVLGVRLWKGQRKAAGSKKFITAVAAPRRTGKSTLLVALGLHACFKSPGARCVIVSAAESNARDRIEEAQLLLARSELTRGSTTDEAKSKITFANGSVLFCRPASPRSIRGLGAGVRLVAIDECSLIDESIWTSAQFLALDHKAEGARILLSDVPWGSREHWWRRFFELGTDRRHPDVASFSWDYRENPVLDAEYLERQRDVMPWSRFQSDVLGEWSDDERQFFSHDLLMGAVADFEPVDADDVSGLALTGGLDYAVRRDSSAFVAICGLPDLGLNEDESRIRFVVPHVEVHPARSIDPLAFVRQIAGYSQAAIPGRGHGDGAGFDFRFLASERNGVGEPLTTELARAIRGRRATVYPLWQSQETKQIAFGRLRTLLADGRLILPRDGELIRSLGSLSARYTDSGGMTIEAVSEAGSHGDAAFALAAATGPFVKDRRSGALLGRYAGRPWRIVREEASRISPVGEVVETGGGVRLPRRPFFADLAMGEAARLHRAGHESYLAGKSEHRQPEEVPR
jgi:hypothetical protein